MVQTLGQLKHQAEFNNSRISQLYYCDKHCGIYFFKSLQGLILLDTFNNIYSFNKYLLNTNCELDTILGNRSTQWTILDIALPIPSNSQAREVVLYHIAQVFQICECLGQIHQGYVIYLAYSVLKNTTSPKYPIKNPTRQSENLAFLGKKLQHHQSMLFTENNYIFGAESWLCPTNRHSFKSAQVYHFQLFPNLMPSPIAVEHHSCFFFFRVKKEYNISYAHMVTKDDKVKFLENSMFHEK